MRTSKDIQNEIEEIRKKDKAINYLQNEGGEGYEQDSVPESLLTEFYTAKEKEFWNEWTVETFNKRRKQWNEYVLSFDGQEGKVSLKQIVDFKNKNGWNLYDLKKANEKLKIV